MAKKPVNYKLDIFQVLNHVGNGDIQYYRNLTEEQQKAFLPLIVMRWLTGTFSGRQIYFINELVNPSIFTNHQHKELLYYLLSIASVDHKSGQRYVWNKTLSKKSTSKPTVVSVIREYFEYNTTQAIEALPLLSNDNILMYAEELGRQKEEISKIKKELKGR